MKVAKNSKLGTPVKDPGGVLDQKLKSSPLTKSSKSQIYSSKNPVVYSPRNKLRERKCVVAKKNMKKERFDSNSTVGIDCKCKKKFGGNSNKCLCVAYENLRASQEEFFRNKAETEAEEEAEEKGDFIENLQEGYGSDNQETDEIENLGQTGSSTIKRRRDELMEEARNRVPESVQVMHLVKAFERLLSIPKSKESAKEGDDEKEPKEEANIENEDCNHQSILSRTSNGGRRNVLEANIENEDESKDSSSSFCPSNFVVTIENLGLDHVSQFLLRGIAVKEGLILSRTSNGGRRNVLEANIENEDESKDSSSSFCPSNFVVTIENLGLDHVSQFLLRGIAVKEGLLMEVEEMPIFCCNKTFSSGLPEILCLNLRWGSLIKDQRANNLSSELISYASDLQSYFQLSSASVGTIGGRRWKKQLKPTSQKLFKLRTEQRGKVKEEEFMKKIQEMMVEQEK
ncbi:hypothetical protein CRYUN_Cryun24cG0095800 [Craigia yunnanensis]